MLIGGPGADQLEGGGGVDRASYWTANAGLTADLQFTHANTGEAAGDTYLGIEELQGTAFGDSLRGNGQANRVIGAGGDDQLYGRGGNDTLQGGAGDDRLEGGVGNDRLQGEAGADTFVFASGIDRVVDFNAAQGDRLALSVSDLGLGGLSAAEIVAAYGDDSSGQVVLDFGPGSRLIIENLDNLDGLDQSLFLF